MSMIIGDIDLKLEGLKEEYESFLEKYISEINTLWTANFNKEDIGNKSDKQTYITQYWSAFLLSILIKQDYLLGYNNTTISNVDISNLMTKLRNNNIDYYSLFKQINGVEKVFNLEVVEDIVEETIQGLEPDEEASAITTYSVSTEDDLDVIVAPTGNIKYNDISSTLGLITEEFNITLQVIGKADDDLIAGYHHNSGRVYLERDGTSLKIIVTDQVNIKTYTIDGTYSSATWLFVLVNIRVKSDAVNVTAFVNGEFRSVSLAETVSSISIPLHNRYVIGANTTGNNRYRKISWYRGQFAQKDIMKEYLYYKNLITI